MSTKADRASARDLSCAVCAVVTERLGRKLDKAIDAARITPEVFSAMARGFYVLEMPHLVAFARALGLTAGELLVAAQKGTQG
jgi:hypothetical protein